ERHSDERTRLMLRVRGLEACIGAAIANQDRFAMRERPASDALADLEARHLADGDRAVAGRLDLELFLELIDDGQRSALEANQLRRGIQDPVQCGAPFDRR